MREKTTFIVCNEHEEIRNLQKSMLIDHGYFHIRETVSIDEAISLLKEDTFLLLPIEKITRNITEKLRMNSNYILFANGQSLNHSAVVELGIKNTLSFPYSSKALIEKIHSLMN